MKLVKLYSCILFIAFYSLSPLNAFAYNNNHFYSSNDILFYDENGESTICSSTQLSGSDNKQKIYNFWISQGLTPEQAAGITGSMESEGGFSPFRQEEAQSWPNGGYGIAQFTGGQRTAVTNSLSSELGKTFTQYYLDEYGGGVSESNGYIPDDVPQDVNDSFLLGELNYLSSYTSSFSPSTIPVRVSGLEADYDLTVKSGEKLLDFIKTLSSAGDAAKAWTYLYEQPSNIKATAAERANNAEEILTEYGGGGSVAGSDNCIVGVGGLTFDQAKTLMEEYYNNRSQYFNSFWNQPGQSNQCTAFVYYFNTRFITTGTGSGDGKDVVDNLLSGFPNFYESADSSSLQPFSIFSLSNSGAGHTGVILGVESDGSIIVGEANVDIGSLNNASGLLDGQTIGDKSDTTKGIVSIERWESIDTWESAMASWNLTDPSFAAPNNGSDVAKKVQDSL